MIPVEPTTSRWSAGHRPEGPRLQPDPVLLREAIRQSVTDPDEIEARSVLAFCAAIGSHFLAADHRDRSRGDILARATEILFGPAR